MASWMVHLRIADLLLNEYDNVEETEFVMGNIAPDSGVPDSEWVRFTPPKEVSHFYDENRKIQFDRYIETYFTKELRNGYSRGQDSFFLGYLTHLVADYLWAQQIFAPCREKHKKEISIDRNKFLWEMKRDWYDLDFLYLSQNPDFRAFQIYKDAKGFENVYMDCFAKDAFENRREYIVGFYSEKREDLNRDYPYLDERHMDQFVEDAVKIIVDKIKLFP